MMSALCNFMFFGHKNCKNELHQTKDNANKEIMRLLTYIEELKAINNYQVYKLEQKIADLEKDKVKKVPAEKQRVTKCHDTKVDEKEVSNE